MGEALLALSRSPRVLPLAEVLRRDGQRTRIPNAAFRVMSSVAQDSDAHNAALRGGDLCLLEIGGEMKAFPLTSSFCHWPTWPHKRWPMHTHAERDIHYYNVVDCARQRRPRGRAQERRSGLFENGGGDEGFPARLELSVASDALANAHVTRTRSLL